MLISKNQKDKLYRAYGTDDFKALDSSKIYYRESTNHKIRFAFLGKVLDHSLKSTCVRPDYLSEKEAPNFPDFDQPQAVIFGSKQAKTKEGDDGFFHVDDEDLEEGL